MGMTQTQCKLISEVVERNQPFWLSVRQSFALSTSKTIDIEGDDFRFSLRQMRLRKYDSKKDLDERVEQALKMITREIETFPGASLFEGVRNQEGKKCQQI